MHNWKDYIFESDIIKTPEFKSFARAFKKFIKHNLPANSELVTFDTGHFYVSGFILNRETSQYVYFCTTDVRHFPGEWYKNLLVRSAKDSQDFRGGSNNYTDLTHFKESVERLSIQ